MMYRFIAAASFGMAASFVFAQAEVEDRTITSGVSSQTATQSSVPANSAPVNTPANNSPANNVAELYYQLQVLQQQVMELRGLAEQQAFQLKKLKQQNLDDYLDLDRRLSQLSKGGAANTASTTPGNRSGVGSSIGSGTGSSGSAAGSLSASGQKPLSESKSYRAAMNLVLKEQKYDEAVVSLIKHLENYPTGRYAANAHYWLGEVYLQQKDLESARTHFTQVINKFSGHAKVPDAQYKLGIVHDLLGDKATAKTMLEQVAQTETNAARLARDYLQKNL